MSKWKEIGDSEIDLRCWADVEQLDGYLEVVIHWLKCNQIRMMFIPLSFHSTPTPIPASSEHKR